MDGKQTILRDTLAERRVVGTALRFGPLLFEVTGVPRFDRDVLAEALTQIHLREVLVVLPMRRGYSHWDRVEAVAQALHHVSRLEAVGSYSGLLELEQESVPSVSMAGFWVRRVLDAWRARRVLDALEVGIEKLVQAREPAAEVAAWVRQALASAAVVSGDGA